MSEQESVWDKVWSWFRTNVFPITLFILGLAVMAFAFVWVGTIIAKDHDTLVMQPAVVNSRGLIQEKATDSLLYITRTHYGEVVSSLREQNSFLMSVITIGLSVLTTAGLVVAFLSWRLKGYYEKFADKVSEAEKLGKILETAVATAGRLAELNEESKRNTEEMSTQLNQLVEEVNRNTARSAQFAPPNDLGVLGEE